MPQSTAWSICGIDTLDADLTLSRVVPWGRSGALAPVSVASSVAPTAGSVVNLLADDSTTVSFAAGDVRQPGFSLTFTFSEPVELWGFRFAGPRPSTWPLRHSVRAGLAACSVSAVDWQGVDVLSSSPTAALNFELPTGVWVERTAGVFTAYKCCALAADGQAIATVEAFGRLWLSMNGGATWAVQQAGSASLSWNGLAMSADGKTIIATVYGGPVWMTNDGGVSWRTVLWSGYWKGCAVSSDGLTLLVGDYNGGNLYLSKDGGATWTAQTAAGGASWSGCAISADGQVLLATRFRGSVWLSKDGGATWGVQTAAGALDWASCAISADGNTLLAVPAGGIPMLSRNKGSTWQSVSALGNKTWWGCGVSGGGSVLIASESNGPLQVSTDSGATWVPQNGAGVRNWYGCAVSQTGGALAAVQGNSAGYPWMRVSPDPIYGATPYRQAIASHEVISGDGASTPQGLIECSKSEMYLAADLEFGGRGLIYGSVSEFDTKAALQRRVRLFRSRDSYLVREVWSGADGSYRFEGINERYEYDIEAWDHEKNYFSAVANNQIPEVAA